MHGYGNYTYADGRFYQGGWSEALYEGHGVMNYPDGLKVEGTYKKGKEHGVMTETDTEGNSEQWVYENGERISKV